MITATFEALDISAISTMDAEESARWAQDNRKQIENAMVEAGTEAICVLLDEDGIRKLRD